MAESKEMSMSAAEASKVETGLTNELVDLASSFH